MKRVLSTNLAIVLVALIAFWFYRQHKNVQNEDLRESAVPELLTNVADLDIELRQYTGAGTRLWEDRDYHTEQTVRALGSKHFLVLPRNSTQIYALRVLRQTALYTIANSSDSSGTVGWTAMSDELEVTDMSPERSFDRLMRKAVRPGLYVIRPRTGGPAQPVFFDPKVVKLVSERAF